MNVQRLWAGVSMALSSLTISVPVYAERGGPSPDAWHGGWGWGWGHMVFGSLMMLLFWGAVVLAIVLAVRWLGGPAHRQGSPQAENRALAILEERFARGEIDKDEFEERKRALSS